MENRTNKVDFIFGERPGFSGLFTAIVIADLRSAFRNFSPTRISSSSCRRTCRRSSTNRFCRSARCCSWCSSSGSSALCWEWISTALVQTAFHPLVFALNTLPGILVYAFLVTMLWSVGINGDNAMDAIVAPIFLQYLAENVEAMTHGQPLPYVTANGFFTTFVNVGGTGATLGLALVLWNSKEPGFRKVSRLSLPTQIFQINEPIFFGIPIVLNPIFMIPYILNALILTTCSYLLMYWNVIQRPFVNVPWTTPPIIGHYLVTGGDWKAAVWGVISIVIADGRLLPVCQSRRTATAESRSGGTARE